MISVILPTYNPHIERLMKTIQGLKIQSLPLTEWELIIIDNNSTQQFQDTISINWHPNARIVLEAKQGLTFARMKGFAEAKGEIIVMVDDDNILKEDYLENAYNLFQSDKELGAVGGKSFPLFESTPPHWITQYYGLLALRDLGNKALSGKWEGIYPSFAPIGAGMSFRKKAITQYIDKINSSKSAISDRKGDSLTSSGDNDMVMEILKAGWYIGYFPQLSLQHIIPEHRTTMKYLARLNHGIQKSWVQFLMSHSISPWPQISSISVPFRKVKSYFTYLAWKNASSYVRWKGACGMYEGLTKID